MKIEVTQKDIDDGQKCWKNFPVSEWCPVTLAIGRTIGVKVWVGTRSWGKQGQYVGKMLPVDVYEWVMQFDDRKPVKPFAFELEGV